MKVLILGATGATGSLTLAAATAAGHRVTALVRDPSRLSAPDSVTVVIGDATSPTDVMAALDGQDALISTLGAGSSMKSSIASEAAAVFIPAAEQLGVRKVVVLSAFGVGETLARASFGQRLIFSSIMKNVFADKNVADAQLRGSSLDWTLLYAVTLNNKPATNAVAVEESVSAMKGTPTVSRADVATELVRALVEPGWSRQTLVIH